jgi:hypothetical protein
MHGPPVTQASAEPTVEKWTTRRLEALDFLPAQPSRLKVVSEQNTGVVKDDAGQRESNRQDQHGNREQSVDDALRQTVSTTPRIYDALDSGIPTGGNDADDENDEEDRSTSYSYPLPQGAAEDYPPAPVRSNAHGASFSTERALAGRRCVRGSVEFTSGRVDWPTPGRRSS